MAFAGALAHAGEDGDALVFLDHGMDQLHHQHGLADAGAAEHGGFAALGERREKIDHLDAGLENRGGRRLLLERGGGLWMPRRGVSAGKRRPAVPHCPDHVEKPPQHRVADRNRNGRAGRTYLRAAGEARGRL